MSKILLSNCDFATSARSIVAVGRGTRLFTGRSEYMLVQVSDSQIIAVSLKTGNRLNNTVCTVQSTFFITKMELLAILEVDNLEDICIQT